MAGITDLIHVAQNILATLGQVAKTLAGGLAVTTGLPIYIVAALPASAAISTQAYASNGRKPGEGVGSGTGVQVFWDGVHWISVSSGTQVLA